MNELGLDNGDMDVVGLHDGTTLQIHGPARCAGTRCSFHNPSDHPLRTAPMIWMPEINLILRVCEHGRTHPDPDSLDFLQSRFVAYNGWHPCCTQRCCHPGSDTE